MDKNHPRRIAAQLTGHAITLFARFITAVRADWRGIEPVPRQRVYFANHTSNGDMPMIWSVLPLALRRQTRPVAAADYWLKNKLRALKPNWQEHKNHGKRPPSQDKHRAPGSPKGAPQGNGACQA